MNNKASMSSVIKSIKGRYILETLMYDNDYNNLRDDEEFCKYYQPKFMEI